MSEQENKMAQESDASQALLIGDRNQRYGIPKGHRLLETDLYFWPNVALGVSLAEGLLPISLASISSIQRGLFPDLFELIFIVITAIGMGFTIGFFAFLILVVLVSAMVDMVLRSLGLGCESFFVATFVGGLVGLLIHLPFYGLASPSALYIPSLWMATLLGQLGGAWGTWKTFKSRLRQGGRVPRLLEDFQFGLRPMFIATVWCAAVLTAMKIMGLLEERFLPFFSHWLAAQIFGVAVISLVGNRWQQRQVTVPRETA